MIPFNKPYLSGKEMHYIQEAVQSGKISGNGMFTQKCQRFLAKRYGFQDALLTTSCTDALEMCALLADIQPGDEVIVPSYTFVSTAVAFVRQGAHIVFADSRRDHPNIDAERIEELVTSRTKAIVPVHYAGVACDMDRIFDVARANNLLVIEDAAQAIESRYRGKALGSIGQLAAFSFHETKNIIAGEGGLLAVNDPRFARRAEIIWEKGTNRAEFFRGEINKYGWVDIGSSFLPSEIVAAYLWAQLENIDDIQRRRIDIYEQYLSGLRRWADRQGIELPTIPAYATNNAHMFYLVCRDLDQRTRLISHLRDNGIHAVFHYQSLHSSDFYKHRTQGRNLPNADRYTDCLVRLPLFYELSGDQVGYIVEKISAFK